MTGYIYKNYLKEDIEIIFEIKCLNHKYLETNFNLPQIFSKLENDFIKILKKHFSRGSFFINIYSNKFIGEYDIYFNEELAKKITENLKKIIKKLKLSKRLYISNLLQFDGIVKITPKNNIEDLNNFIFEAFEKTLLELKNQMGLEGDFLKNEIKKIIYIINDNLNKIKKQSQNENIKIFNKIKEKINLLISNKEIDENKILEEAALQWTKIDITEEITRLDSHLNYLSKLFDDDENNGKKIDFLCQEILREANTICSKAVSSDIIYSSIEIKNNVEKIREQIRNIS
jgi:uncharacterized protein (TIGR00255 family)